MAIKAWDHQPLDQGISRKCSVHDSGMVLAENLRWLETLGLQWRKWDLPVRKCLDDWSKDHVIQSERL